VGVQILLVYFGYCKMATYLLTAKILWAVVTAKYCNTVSSSTVVAVFFVVFLMEVLIT